MNRKKNKLLFILLMLTFPIFATEIFMIKNHNCSSAPILYKVIRAKKPIKVHDYTYSYDSKDVDIENGIVGESSGKQVVLENSNGKVQVIIIKNIASNGSRYLSEEYFFNQKVYCITLDKKKCYSMPEEFFRPAKESSFGVQWLCPNQIITTQPSKPMSNQEKYVGTNTTIGGSPFKPIYESSITESIN